MLDCGDGGESRRFAEIKAPPPLPKKKTWWLSGMCGREITDAGLEMKSRYSLRGMKWIEWRVADFFFLIDEAHGQASRVQKVETSVTHTKNMQPCLNRTCLHDSLVSSRVKLLKSNVPEQLDIWAEWNGEIRIKLHKTSEIRPHAKSGEASSNRASRWWIWRALHRMRIFNFTQCLFFHRSNAKWRNQTWQHLNFRLWNVIRLVPDKP